MIDGCQEVYALRRARAGAGVTDPGSIAALRERHGPRYRWLLLMAVMVGTMASIMSSTVVNVAIPGISGHFGIGQERAQWVSSGFMVAMTSSMLTTPWLLARFGYRGFQLDVGRNFHSKETVFRWLDLMARYKLNTFHFHLTDDEGWRIEIAGLPELTSIGAVRGHAARTTAAGLQESPRTLLAIGRA